MLTDDQIVSTFCIVDDFLSNLKLQHPELPSEKPMRGFPCKLHYSEIITLCILFQFSGYRNFKSFYFYARTYLKKDFPHLVSYSRFVTLKKEAAPAMFVLLNSFFGSCTGISFIDSSSINVCHNKRIFRNKVFKKTAKRGRTSMCWFFGFKIHVIISHEGELLGFMFTAGNVDDRAPVKDLCKDLFGKLFGDRGYISSELFNKLLKTGLQLITNIKANMKNKLVPLFDKLLLRKRFIIETVFGILKEEFHLEHTRHRSPANFVVNLLGSLIAYCLRPNKPSIRLTKQDQLVAQGF
jgi:Transposase DDE domain